MHVTSIPISSPENFWAMVLDATRSVECKIKKKKISPNWHIHWNPGGLVELATCLSAPKHSERVGLLFQGLLSLQNYSSFSNVEPNTKIPNPFSNWTATLKHVRVRLYMDQSQSSSL